MTPAEGSRSATGRLIVILAIAFGLAALVGAYVDWMWWPVYQGLILTLAAFAILIVGAVVAIVGRSTVRRAGLVALAIGVGLVAGQNLGPSREPLIETDGGTMTIRLESPVAVVASGAAQCSLAASGQEHAVSGNPVARLTSLGQVVDQVYLNVGDRWEAIDDVPRKDGVRLDILATAEKIPDNGFPSMVTMGATERSTLEVTFGSEGGTARFAGLEVRPREGDTGGALDLAGTLEWTCGDVVTEEGARASLHAGPGNNGREMVVPPV